MTHGPVMGAATSNRTRSLAADRGTDLGFCAFAAGS